MTIRIKNIQYFDWDIPEELNTTPDIPTELIQQLVNEHFDPDNISVALASDDYYEFEEIL